MIEPDAQHTLDLGSSNNDRLRTGSGIVTFTTLIGSGKVGFTMFKTAYQHRISLDSEGTTVATRTPFEHTSFFLIRHPLARTEYVIPCPFSFADAVDLSTSLSTPDTIESLEIDDSPSDASEEEEEEEEKDTSKSGVMTFDASLSVGRVGFVIFSEVFNLKTAKVAQGC